MIKTHSDPFPNLKDYSFIDVVGSRNPVRGREEIYTVTACRIIKDANGASVFESIPLRSFEGLLEAELFSDELREQMKVRT